MKKRRTVANIKPSVNYRSGRPNKEKRTSKWGSAGRTNKKRKNLGTKKGSILQLFNLT